MAVDEEAAHVSLQLQRAALRQVNRAILQLFREDHQPAANVRLYRVDLYHPCALYSDDAVISESIDGKKVSATTEMYPPWPYTAFADSWPRFMNNNPGLLIVMFPQS